MTRDQDTRSFIGLPLALVAKSECHEVLSLCHRLTITFLYCGLVLGLNADINNSTGGVNKIINQVGNSAKGISIRFLVLS